MKTFLLILTIIATTQVQAAKILNNNTVVLTEIMSDTHFIAQVETELLKEIETLFPEEVMELTYTKWFGSRFKYDEGSQHYTYILGYTTAPSATFPGETCAVIVDYIKYSKGDRPSTKAFEINCKPFPGQLP